MLANADAHPEHNSITYTTNSNLFSIDNDGVITFSPIDVHQYEENEFVVYEGIFTISDGTNNITEILSIQVNNTDNSSIFSADLFEIEEDSFITTIGTVTLRDNENSITYSLSDDNNGLFTIDSTTGELSFLTRVTPDFESLENNILNVTIIANNGLQQEDSILSHIVSIIITDEDENINLADVSNGNKGFRLNGEVTDGTGRSVSILGDINNDGFADIFVGSPNYSDKSGRGWVIFGGEIKFSDIDLSANTLASSQQGFEIIGNSSGFLRHVSFGSGVTPVGDFNNDGYDDFVVRTDLSAETLYYFSGGETSFTNLALDDHPYYYHDGPTGGERFGYDLSGNGDINGDGFDDFIVGAPLYGFDDVGKAYVYFGGEQIPPPYLNQISLTGDIEEGEQGRSVAILGDINNDGFDDFAVGSEFGDQSSINNSTNGRVNVFLGGSDRANNDISISTRDFYISGYSNLELGPSLGVDISALGDINGDDYDDFVVLSHGIDEGKAYIIWGDNNFNNLQLSSLIQSNKRLIIRGLSTSNKKKVSPVGDVNGDGYNDIMISDPTSDGEIHIIFGGKRIRNYDDFSLQTHNLVETKRGFTITGLDNDYDNDNLAGYSIGGGGTINDDHYDDIIIGTPGQGNAYVIYGRDFLNESILGSGTIIGTDGNDIIVGDNDDDIIYAFGGNDALYGYDGNDTFVTSSDAFVEIEGGEGTDILEITSSNFNLTLNSHKINSVEIIYLGEGNNSLKIKTKDIDNIGVDADDGKRELIIKGNYGDSIALSSTNPWIQKKPIVYQDDPYDVFEIENYRLLISPNINLDNVNIQHFQFLTLNSNFLDTGFSSKISPNQLEDNLGHTLSSAGDVDGDGFDDFLVGTETEVFLFLGKNINDNNDINFEDATKFFGVGSNNESLKVSSAGDINGDGFDDILIGADRQGTNREGDAYVIFGKNTDFTDIDLSTNLTVNDNGFKITGGESSSSSPFSNALNYERGMITSSAGDINGDGFDDIIVANHSANDNRGESYLIFGSSNDFSNIDLTTDIASNGLGFKITGANEGDFSGYSVSSGDVNGDSLNDIIIGSLRNNQASNGKVYVILGKEEEFTNITLGDNLFDQNLGFIINPEYSISDTTNNYGFNISGIGDTNGDGFDDILIGSPYSSSNYIGLNNGSVDIYYGRDNITNGTAERAIIGAQEEDKIGAEVSAIGDINGDGFDDFAIIGPYTNNSETKISVHFGREQQLSITSSFDTILINEDNDGFSIESSEEGSLINASKAGDINGDGFDDLVLTSSSEATYIIYGRDFLHDPTLTIVSENFTGTNEVENIVGSSRDNSIKSQGGADTISTGAGNDTIFVIDTNFF